MIEVRKYIPQVYNQSRDFSVFMGVTQSIINGLDIKSKILENLPSETILPGNLSFYPQLRSKFRNLLKNKGSLSGILYSITLAGGKFISFEEEFNYLKGFRYEDEGYRGVSMALVESKDDYFNRGVNTTGNLEINELTFTNSKKINKNSLVYYIERLNGGVKLHINIKDLSKINQDLLSELWYYIKPVNTVIMLEQYNSPE